MAQYLLSVYQPVGPAPEILEPIRQALEALNREMKAAGTWVCAAGLHPSDTATVVRQQGTDVLIMDGPFAEAKEHLGGFTVIEAADLDAVLGWAGKLARAATLPIEVRPIQH